MFILRIAIVSFSFLNACGNPEYSSAAPDNGGTRTSASAEGENLKNRIAVKGLSLDLHAIVDTSGSLRKTDPACNRFEALKVFFSELKSTLGPNPDARLSLTIFNSTATFVANDDGFLNLSESEFDSKYRNVICSSSGNTNAAQAFSVAAENAKVLMKNSPKKVSSVLIFTDGKPNVVPIETTLTEASKLRDVFPDRVFGILLDRGSEEVGNSMFLTQVAGAEERVRRVSQTTDLADALKSFLK